MNATEEKTVSWYAIISLTDQFLFFFLYDLMWLKPIEIVKMKMLWSTKCLDKFIRKLFRILILDS